MYNIHNESGELVHANANYRIAEYYREHFPAFTLTDASPELYKSGTLESAALLMGSVFCAGLLVIIAATFNL